jgi:hypothetical protein
MALSRRLLNLIVDNRTPGAKSLCCIDLASKHFFDKTPAQPGLADDKAAEAALKMERIQLPNPIFNFVAARSDLDGPWKIDCFPFADRRVICADQWGRSFLFEADRCRVVTMPRLHQPKVMPISLFIPSPDVNDLDGSTGGNLFIMERVTKPGFCNQFEAFIYCHPERNRYFKSWDCQLLPPPPYISDATYLGMCPKITSYTVLGDDIHICISVEGIGTYRLDTRSRTWSEVGKWNLPVYGKVEYLPELKLWFGFSGEAQDFAAVDLSSMDSQPQLVGTCKEFYPPEEWKQCKDSQLVNLGSGKFCIARFFHTRTPDSGNELIEQNITVLTCVEVVRRVHDGNGNDSTGTVELQMIPYKSRCYISTGDDTIQTVF